jgi:hypothetical protein
VDWIADRITAAWGASGWDKPEGITGHEAKILKLVAPRPATLWAGARRGGWASRLNGSWNGTRGKRRAKTRALSYRQLADYRTAFTS